MDHTTRTTRLLAFLVLTGLTITASAQSNPPQTKSVQTKSVQINDPKTRSAQGQDTQTKSSQSPDTQSFNPPNAPNSVNIGLVYPLSTNGRYAKQRTNFLSLNAIAGVSRAETGASIAGLANIIYDQASGCQIAGFLNFTRNRSAGAQIAGFLNTAGAANVQIAGFANKAGNSNVQLAGFLNKSGNVHTQVAGFINVAKKVKGVQLAGFLNIADSSDYPIGIINIIKNGERSIGLSVDESRTALLSFRSGGRKLYGMIGLGYNDRTHPLQNAQAGNDALKLATAEAGIGAHWNLTSTFRVNTELAAITATDFKHGDYQRYVFRLLPSLHIQRLEVFAGPTFNYVSSEKGLRVEGINHYTWSKNAGSRNFQALYFGAIAGLNYRL